MTAGTINKGQTVKFSYVKLDDTETITIDRLEVEDVYQSAAGYTIITGFLDEDHETARSFRAERISELEYV